MSFWGKKGLSTARPNTPKIRIEKVAATTQPVSLKRIKHPETKAKPSSASSVQLRPLDLPDSQSDSSDCKRLIPRNGVKTRKRSPIEQRIESDSDDDGSILSYEATPNKKAKVVANATVDLRRRLSLQAFTEDDRNILIHSADIACLKRKFTPAFTSTSTDDICVYLQYPGSLHPERYELVFRGEDFNPIREIIKVVRDFTNFYLTLDQAKPFLDPQKGIIRQLERARNIGSLSGFKAALDAHNATADKLRMDGALARNIDGKHHLPLELVKRIVRQTYDRAVSPRIDLLKKYENGTDFIYGELKRRFVFNILVETKMTSDQVFVDLGSGVANVVLQAALQIGCESWGCEIMENACTLAKAQKAEFEARCRLWGILPGAVKLEHGNFMMNDNIRQAIRRADVVLVNNEVFTPELNNDLVNLFLDLKDGCKIVSLKSFVPYNHKITTYNLNNPVNLLDVEQRTYSSKSVSWKNEGGQYFISTKDSRRLQSYGHLAQDARTSSDRKRHDR